MKNLKITLLVFLTSFSIGLTSCSSDDDDSTPQNQDPDTYIRFAINDTNYEFINILTAESEVITLNGNNGPELTDPGDTGIALWLPLAIENGSFNIETGQNATHKLSFTSQALSFEFDFANTGTITVTQATGQFIEGTFSATVTNDDDTTITIENGSFKASGI